MAAAPALLDAGGRPIPAAPARRVRASATAYHGADPASQDLARWMPPGWSIDTALGWNRELLVNRLHDLVRNDGWAAGTVTSLCNAVIGCGLRFNSRPDWRALGIDFETSRQLGQAIETGWRNYVDDPRRYADLQRRHSLGERLNLSFRHFMIDGECLVACGWRGDDRFPYRTCFQGIHPARLSNPLGRQDEDRLRGGVELDRNTTPTGYHIRKRHPGEQHLAGNATAGVTWQRVPRETSWGRPVMIHWFRAEEEGQTRGVSPLAPIVRRLRMNQLYESYELQAAVANAVLAAYLETSLSPEAAAERIDAPSSLAEMDERRLQFYSDAPITLAGFRIPVLPAGDRINFATPARPNREAAGFVTQSLRYLAAATGLNPTTISRDYSQTNYSSERAAMLEAWRTITTAREQIAAAVATPMLLCWLEEAIERGRVVVPDGVPGLWDAPAAWVQGRWIGPGRGWVDPVKEETGSTLRMQNMTSTLEQECAEHGLDWQEVIEQRRAELAEMEGLPAPPVPDSRAAMRDDSEERKAA